MKKLLMLSALAMVISAPVLAQEDGGRRGPGRHGNPEKRVEKMFDRQDENGDGVVSKKEFMGTAEERFEKMDTNSDGEVTKEEVKEHAEQKKKEMQEKREKVKKCLEEVAAEED